jgi:hypothetical protein
MLLLIIFGAFLALGNGGTLELLECVRNCDPTVSVHIFKGCVTTCSLLHIPQEAGVAHTNALINEKYAELKRKRDEERSVH